MKRLHLFELEDQDWFPSSIRSYMTDYLQFGWNFFKLGDPLVPVIERAIQESTVTEVTDLCSGGGGPVLFLQKELLDNELDITFNLTDYFPNKNAFKTAEAISKGKIRGVSKKIDARNVEDSMKGLRTLFSSFHHFKPIDAKAILNDASSKGKPILIAEYTERSLSCMLKISMSTLFFIFFLTPFIKPFSFKRLLFTYLLPVVPLCLFWDGIISCLRSYSEEELRGLTEDITPEGYKWEIRNSVVNGNKVTYLLGLQESMELKKVG